MGTAGAILGATALGFGAAAMNRKQQKAFASEVHSTMTPTRPETPEPPEPLEDVGGAGATDNALMEAERERQQAALRKQQAQEIFTSGLGAAGLAETSKKTLLGG